MKFEKRFYPDIITALVNEDGSLNIKQENGKWVIDIKKVQHSDPTKPDSETAESIDSEPASNQWRVISLTRAEYNDGADSHLRVIDFDTGEVTLLDTNNEEFSNTEGLRQAMSSALHKLMKGDGSFLIIDDIQIENGYVGTYFIDQHELEQNPHFPIYATYGNMLDLSESTQKLFTADILGVNEIQFIFSGDFDENPSDEKNPDDIVFTIMYK